MSDDKHFFCSHLVTLDWNGGHVSANMEKIGTRGATFNIEQPIELGCEMHVSAPEWEVTGTVSKCELVEDGFLVDIEFAGGYEWEPASFQPGHLTDLDVLLVRKLLSEFAPGR